MGNRTGSTFTIHGSCNIKKIAKFSSSSTPTLAVGSGTPFFLRKRATAAIIGLSLVATRNTLLQVVLGSSNSSSGSSNPFWLERQRQQQRTATKHEGRCLSSPNNTANHYKSPTTRIITLLLVQLLPLIPSIKPNIGLFISSPLFAEPRRTNLIFGISTSKYGQTSSRIVDSESASIVLLRQHSEKRSNAEEETPARLLLTQEEKKTKNYLPFRASWKRVSNHNNNYSQQQRHHSTMSSSTATITLDVLQRKDASTTNAILDYFHSNELFDKWANYQSKLILTRDMEDGEKLQKGIDIAVERGTLNKLATIEPYLDVDVVGKTPNEVATFIWNQVLEQKKALGEQGNDEEGELIVLCGLSGTGKGTTFATLGNKLRTEKKDPTKVVNWSNGNVFRSVTLLCVLWCENQGPDVHVPSALTKENISNFMKMLTFGKYDGQFDIRIQGMGLDTTVSQIENTLLKQTRVAKNIPTVAEQIQGEVVKFANDAMTLLKQAGMTILLEGREQTLNYMTTPYKFRLILSDESLIGKRRAAQRLMAQTLERIQNNNSDDSHDIHDILDSVLQSLAEEDLGDGTK